MKILWKGNVFNPTGIATANREMIKALIKQKNKVQCVDPWHDKYEFTKDMECLNYPINVGKADATIFADYPQFWQGGYGKLIGHFLHEGTVLHKGWPDALNTVEKVFVPSQATKNLFRWNNVVVPIEVIPYGVSELYKPKEFPKEKDFLFLSVNSWTGEPGDRKGTDLLVKAFDEEFKDENVKLVLKIGTFWQGKTDYMAAIYKILGHTNPNILFNDAYTPEEELVKFYQKADCFVAPTRGEAFGLTILNAMACGLPVIVTKDRNSGHMDFCKGVSSVLWIDAPTVEQGSLRFYAQGNMLAKPDLESLKKQMRFCFESKNELKEKALSNSEQIRKVWTWENTAKKIEEFLK